MIHRFVACLSVRQIFSDGIWAFSIHLETWEIDADNKFFGSSSWLRNSEWLGKRLMINEYCWYLR